MLTMKRAAQMLLGVWLAGAMTLVQACAGPAGNTHEYGFGASKAGSESASGSGRSSSPGSAPNLSGMVVDKDASLALTAHFQRNRLPLVGGQVLRNPSTGQRAVVLYGYVATDRGKSDAQRQAEDYINDPEVDVENRVVVDSQLLAASQANVPGAGANNSNGGYYDPNAAQSANSTSGAQGYYDQQNQSAQIQQYQQYQQPGAPGMNSLAPLVALLGILGAGMATSGPGGFAVGPGYPSTYGYPGAYPPYGGVPAPMTPMAPITPMTPMAPFGYGGSPFGFSGPFSTFP